MNVCTDSVIKYIKHVCHWCVGGGKVGVVEVVLCR